MWLGVIVGAGLALGAIVALGGSGSTGTVAAGDKGPSCIVTLYLLAPDGFAGEILDGSTGGAGFSHIVAGGCEVDDEGKTLIYDCQPGQGVFRGHLDAYEGREQVRIELLGAGARELLGGLRARVGRPYGPEVTCSSIIRDSLPAGLRERVNAAGRPPTPNSIAAAFGIGGTASEDIQVDAE